MPSYYIIIKVTTLSGFTSEPFFCLELEHAVFFEPSQISTVHQKEL